MIQVMIGSVFCSVGRDQTPRLISLRFGLSEEMNEVKRALNFRIIKTACSQPRR
jgi:hypothetical protein